MLYAPICSSGYARCHCCCRRSSRSCSCCQSCIPGCGSGTFGNVFYLNASFAICRGIAYLVVWFGLAAFALRAATRGLIAAPLAVIGLILLAFTVTFATIDATMSLDPHFASSSYGMIAGAESGLLALSVCVLAAALDPCVPLHAFNDLGQLLLGLLVLWAYLDFMQVLIVWNSNLRARRRGTWHAPRMDGASWPRLWLSATS